MSFLLTLAPLASCRDPHLEHPRGPARTSEGTQTSTGLVDFRSDDLTARRDQNRISNLRYFSSRRRNVSGDVVVELVCAETQPCPTTEWIPSLNTARDLWSVSK